MIEHISIRAFQSWHKLDLDLGPVTMLVGKGNSGKTAIVRALKYALTNQTGDDFIREGAKETQVGIAFGDEVLLWTKPRGKGAEYFLSPDQRFTKTGAAVPQEIADATRIYEIAIDKTTSLMPNIQMQFDTPFIIGESGSKIARTLGRLTKLNILVTAQIACRRDAEVARQQARAATDLMAQTDAQIVAFPDTTDLKEQLAQAEQLDNAVANQRARIIRAKVLREQHAVYRARQEAGENATKLSQEAWKLFEESTRLKNARQLVEKRFSLCIKTADACVVIDDTREQLTILSDQYKEQCQESGVCEACPWR